MTSNESNAPGGGQPEPQESKLPKSLPRRRKDGKIAKRGGPKTLLTGKLMRAIEREAANGLTLKEIAEVVGISQSRLSIWKNRDGKLEEKLRAAIEKGRAIGLQRRLRRIEKAAKKNWGADAWWIERQYPERFGKVQNLRVGDPDGKPIQQAPTVIAPTVVFVQPEKQPIPATIDVPAKNGDGHQLPNGLPNGNGKH